MDIKKIKKISSQIILLILVVVSFVEIINNHKDKYIAKVNGKKIYASEYIHRLRQNNSEPILKDIINEKLIEQEAKSKKISVSKELVKEELDKIEKNLSDQGKDMKSELATRKMSIDDLKNQIEIQKMTEKIVNLNIVITEDDVDSFMAINKDNLPKNIPTNQLRTMVRDEVKNRLQTGKISNWVDSLYRKAKISYY